MSMKWDSDTYSRDFSFVYKYGEDLIRLLNLKKGIKVLDLGCGTGELTEKLYEAGAIANGIDASAEQISRAREKFPHICFRQADAVSFAMPEQMDAVFSNALFHWIQSDDQPKMLRSIWNALKPGGQLVFEMGGSGNNAKIHAALAKAFSAHGFTYQEPFYFPTIGGYASVLENAGFRVTDMRLFERPTELTGTGGMAEWITMFVQKPFETAFVPEKDRQRIILEAVEMLKPALCRDGVWIADYVRLRGRCVKIV